MSASDNTLVPSSPRRNRSDEHATAEQRVWQHFRDHGINVRAWATDHGFNPGLVYSVLRGERKCLRGQSHEVAVALGLK
jgi:gp16 family phage-associated protein